MLLCQIFSVVLVLKATYAETETVELSYPEDTGLAPTQLIEKYGYPLQRYWVQTEDGYILEMFRIPHGLGNSRVKNKVPILFFHGLLSSAADFVNTGAKNSPAFIFADLGYDVWLGNARGTTYSRNHTYLRPYEKEFWEFSFTEIGYYDLPTLIDFIIKTNGQQKIFYIGHSQGATAAYVMNSLRPQYNEKIRLIVSLAPLVYMQNLYNPVFQFLSTMNEEIESILRSLDKYELFRHTGNYGYVVYCADGSKTQISCLTYYASISGYNIRQMNKTMLPIYLTNAPSGASYKEIIHYLQEIQSGHFCEYDYGPEINLEVYGQKYPPDFDLGQVTTPVAILYSDGDWLTSTVDMEHLYKELGNPVLYYKIKDDNFTHLDFLWAIDIIPLVYRKVIEVMRLY